MGTRPPTVYFSRGSPAYPAALVFSLPAHFCHPAGSQGNRATGNRRTGTSLDLPSPRSLDFGWIVQRGIAKTGKKSRGHIGPLVGGQRRYLANKGLRAGGHTAILDSTWQPNDRLHPTFAGRRMRAAA
jgi:hypothetical protein